MLRDLHGLKLGQCCKNKVRLGAITAAQPEGFYDDFCQMPIDYLDSDDIRTKTYAITEKFSLATLYDASFLAVTELESAGFLDSRPISTQQAYIMSNMGQKAQIKG